MRKSILLPILCFLTSTIIYSQEWVTFTKTTPEQPIIELIISTNQQVEFNVEVCGMYKTGITEEGELFQRIEIPGAGKTSETGSPELPYIRQLIAIPECDDVVLLVNITGQTDFSYYNIYPSPDFDEVQNPDGTVYLQEVFTKNEAIYNQNNNLPGMNAEIVSTGYLRDQKYAEVYLYPVQFNPILKHINVFTHYEITLEFINPSTQVNENTGIFNNVATNTMLNYVSSGMTASINDKVQGNGNVQWIELTETSQADNIVADYLIICAEPFFEPDEPESEVLRIANHRASYNGFDVAIINANTVISDELGFFFEGQNNVPPDLQYKKEQRIRTCIRRIYEGENAQHTYDGKLGYVLLIGDIELNPTPENPGMPSSYDHVTFGSGPSDYYFSCLTKEDDIYDKVADLYIGRFCVDNNETTGFFELHNIVKKTIYFESEYSFGDWRNHISHANGNSYAEDYFPGYYNFIEELLFEEELTVVNWYPLNEQIFQPTLDMLNEGSPIMMYEGHGEFNSWQDNLNIDEIISTLNNTGEFPYVTSRACNTGWFDNEGECLGETLTTYAEDKGFVGFLGAARFHFQQPNPPPITDPPTFLQERVPYAIWHDLSHITGEFILEAKIGLNMFGTAFLYNYFGDPALNVMAMGFEVTHDIVLPEYTIISTNITVRNGAQLKIPSNGQLYFENEGSLTIEDGASLYLMPYATITGNSSEQKITIEGGLTVSSYAVFNSLSDTEWGGIELDNLSNNYYFNNSSFENCNLSGESKSLTVQNSQFNNSAIKYSKGDLFIENALFDNSPISAKKGDSKSSIVEINSETTIKNYIGEVAVYIEGYANFDIDDCTIEYNNKDGISIFNSGGSWGTKNVRNNTIINNGYNNNGAGIKLYNSYANLSGDQLIEGNYYGILSLDNSNLSIRGNSAANYTYETQLIRDNKKHQIYATQNSFPYQIKWNGIIDEDNTTPLVYYSTTLIEELDVSDNYWGNNFDPVSDLFPYSSYNYLPIWELNNGSGGAEGAEAMYNSAQEKITQEDYSGAKTDFQQIINDYPTSKYSQAALRELFSLEEYASDDYVELKAYYSTNSIILNNPELEKLAEYLANYCEIKLENYPTAISWFENIILNPETIEDSIFAIIDLGYTYFIMENGGLKSAYAGNLIEHIPESMNQFIVKRDYLLTLLFKDSEMNEAIEGGLKKLKCGELLQNVPNPFKGTTQIWYKLESESIVQLSIYNYTGQLIKSYNEGTKTKGNHHIDFDANGLKNGIYFYSISVNGQITDSKKMTIMN